MNKPAIQALVTLILAGVIYACNGGLPEGVLPTKGVYGDPTQCGDEWAAGTPLSDKAVTRLLCRAEYISVYDPNTKLSLVTGEYLQPAELRGGAERQDNFRPDPDLPEGESAELNDYRRSGYDRGHLAPAADFKANEQAMSESFYLSNMVPQNHDMNAGVWAGLESATRDCAYGEGGVYVLTGPVLAARPLTIGEGRVAVPDALYKMVVSGAEVRAFLIPNEPQGSVTGFSDYERTAAEIEVLTGLNLFPAGGVNTAAKGRFCKGSFGG